MIVAIEAPRTATRAPLLLPLLLLAMPAPSSAQVCVGDCNGDLEVRLGEVQTAFNIFLGTVAPSECEAADANGTGEVKLGEVPGLVRVSGNTQGGLDLRPEVAYEGLVDVLSTEDPRGFRRLVPPV